MSLVQFRPEAYADLAHLVERNLAKVEVAGPSPVIRLETAMKILSLFSFRFTRDSVFPGPEVIKEGKRSTKPRGRLVRVYSASPRAVSDRRNDEPEPNDNLARSPFVQPKHARDKSRGLTAAFQARIGTGRALENRKLPLPPRAHTHKPCF